MSTYTGSSITDLSVATPLEGINGDPVSDTNDAIRQIKSFLRNPASGGFVDLIYPIGCIWNSFTSDAPSTAIQTQFGLGAPFGTWYKLEEVTLVGHKSGSTEFGTVTPVAASGEAPDTGEKTTTLDTDNVPHISVFDTDSGGTTAPTNVPYDGTTINVASGDFNASGTPFSLKITSEAQTTEPSNIQPSRTIYMWTRVA